MVNVVTTLCVTQKAFLFDASKTFFTVWKWKWSDIQPSMVTHIRNLCSAINPSKVHTHSSEHTHTLWTHTRSSGQPFMLRCPGSSWGFGALLKGTSVVVLKVERALYIHSPHLQFLPARDSNSQPLDYESDSLTIRPRLPIQHILLILYCSSCLNLFGRLKCEMYLLYISPCLLTLTSQLSIGAIVSGLEFAHFCDVIS